ncbi:hypothetical protein ACTMSW_24860 [Micromonospora sp. BQ11]|uniref:hypothetical protein n=1 Tax=Micromonospora sp. BQ11 TaxID=3452212 RepID=UPI003F88EF1F
MITRRGLLGATAGAGMLAITTATAAHAADSHARWWTGATSANGWRIDPAAIATYRIEGSHATVALRQPPVATVLLHVARRWHYEIAALDSGEGGGIAGHTSHRRLRADFESNYLSGTAVALHPTAYPSGGSERLWPQHEAIVRDILADCDGIVIWGGDLTPAKASHFHLVAHPDDRALTRVANRLNTGRPSRIRLQTAGMVADPASPTRRAKALSLPRTR